MLSYHIAVSSKTYMPRMSYEAKSESLVDTTSDAIRVDAEVMLFCYTSWRFGRSLSSQANLRHIGNTFTFYAAKKSAGVVGTRFTRVGFLVAHIRWEQRSCMYMYMLYYKIQTIDIGESPILNNLTRANLPNNAFIHIPMKTKYCAFGIRVKWSLCGSILQTTVNTYCNGPTIIIIWNQLVLAYLRGIYVKLCATICGHSKIRSNIPIHMMVPYLLTTAIMKLAT
jgi:hypothetical protein